MTTTTKNKEFNFFYDDVDVNKYPIGLPDGVDPEPCEYDFSKINQWYKDVGYKTGKKFIDLSDEEKEEFKIDKYKKK